MVGELPAPDHPEAGGPANATDRLVRAMVDEGVTVSVISPVPLAEKQHKLQLHGATVIRVPHDERYALPRRLGPWKRAAIPVIESLRADIVHGQGVITGGV